MGWKSVKEYYRITHDVAVYPEKGICIGSPYIHDIIVISMATGAIVRRWGGPHRDPISRYLAEMDADPAKLAELVAQQDTFERSIPVYTYEGADIVECFCEELGWPNVTHDGRMMYENTFSADRDQVVKWALRNARASVEAWGDQLQDAKRRFDEVVGHQEEARHRLAVFGAMDAEIAKRRPARVIKALGQRISNLGDMHIPVSRRTMKVLLDTLGLGDWDPGCDDVREVDALALDILRELAERAIKA
ncbi:hypothetical protein EDF57_103569 [Novosphingobium sp. PhB55]|uniref:hypothetical protein n=1 Tax=Novosphingobium sp. PhB55 TaxID=2485106 RepID=UPI001066A204|nr:hypothetical protein [Novosphingobium sp. PhB55]TDW65385.1 hypothetical protein EDF57_103569 [Novosphingobium sp. PhB55]